MISSVDPVGITGNDYNVYLQKQLSAKTPSGEVCCCGKNATFVPPKTPFVEDPGNDSFNLIEDIPDETINNYLETLGIAPSGSKAEDFINITEELIMQSYTGEDDFCASKTAPLQANITYIDVIGGKLSEKLPEISPEKSYVYVIDGFNKTFDFDSDGIFDISHGELVSGLIHDINPELEIIAFDVADSYLPNAQISLGEINSALDSISNVIRDGDYLNISLGSFFEVSEYTQTQLDYLTNIDSVTTKIENIALSGANVAISSGNAGAKYGNTFSLAQNAVVVGALTTDGNKTSYSSTYGVDAWAQGDYLLNTIKDTNNNILGYDLTGNGDVDLSKSLFSGTILPELEFLLQGTSFAAPTWIANASLGLLSPTTPPPATATARLANNIPLSTVSVQYDIPEEPTELTEENLKIYQEERYEFFRFQATRSMAWSAIRRLEELRQELYSDDEYEYKSLNL